MSVFAIFSHEIALVSGTLECIDIPNLALPMQSRPYWHPPVQLNKVKAWPREVVPVYLDFQVNPGDMLSEGNKCKECEAKL